MTADRADYIAGLRALADLLEQHDELPLPYEGNTVPLTFHYLSSPDPKAGLATFARIIPGALTKTPWGGESDYIYFDLAGSIDGLKVNATAYRDAVCTRVVKGTREVTKVIPDPAAPTVTVTETVVDVEWVCSPVLAAVREDVTA